LPHKIWTLVKKDWWLEWSYPFAAFSRLFTMFAELVTFYFVGHLVAEKDYFGFVVVGLAYGSLLNASLHGLSSKIHQEQMMGTLESLLATPTPLYLILTGMAAWSVGYAAVEMVAYAVLATGIFGLTLQPSRLLALGGVTVLSLAAFLSLGLLGAAWVLRFKRGDPASWAVTTVSAVISGTFFPVSLFPEWLQSLAQLSPLTHTLNAARALWLGGHEDIRPAVNFLLIFTGLTLPSGLLALKAAYRSCRLRGLLATY